MTYHSTFSGFRDGEPTDPWPFTEDCVILRVRDEEGHFAKFSDGQRDLWIYALYFREHDYTGAVEWSTSDDVYDQEAITVTPVTDLPDSWPRELRDYLISEVADVAIHEEQGA